MNDIAIIGPTASGKSDLALEIAKAHNAYIFSIDSLSIYKEIDIASAKPSLQDRTSIKHFGIDTLYPNEKFNVADLIHWYQALKEKATLEGKNIVIVGGSSFYLKSLLHGISDLPSNIEEYQDEANTMLQDLEKVYALLHTIDAKSISKIAKNDRYRLEKLLLIYLATKKAPSTWFTDHPAKGTIEELPIYNIHVSRDVLKERIITRTHTMLRMGLIDEICYLEHKYSRLPQSMGAIGIVEVLKYLDGLCSKQEMLEDIIMHTAQLAKRQQTFNNTQFEDVISKELNPLREQILSDLKIIS